MGERVQHALTSAEIGNAAVYVRQVYVRRGVDIPTASFLNMILLETEKFAASVTDVQPPTTGSSQDDLALMMAGKQLLTFRLAESLRELERVNTPGLTERIRELVTKNAGDPQHEEQFLDAEYETFCASEITFDSCRVSFIHSRQETARLQKRVEFLISHKWPVECKRPQASHTVVRNLRAAVEKIVERSQPGIVCLSLDAVLSLARPFAEFDSESDLLDAAAAKFHELWQSLKDDVLAAIRGTPVRVVLIHHVQPSYFHQTETAGLPTLRLAISPDGKLISTNVIATCLALLEANQA
jgi:hypothetical protein